ncbi:hypothetical protein [Natranaerovirga pectinivora]|uniref:hypothetical protein n=1 Tax=Natranaerovirga pectinivora TaxID=682400 RepID=UPI001048C71D|nr:hypothetical protein [Natranaerovirga pectinivora]
MGKIETFESPELIYNFTGDWLRTTQRAYQGSFSYGSRSIGHSQETNAYLTIHTDYIEFYWYVSSEGGYDFFEFYIDGEIKIRASGTSNTWTKFSENLPRRAYTFRWRYVKDGSVSRGDDRAYIDNLFINEGEKRYFIEDENVLKVWSETQEKYMPVINDEAKTLTANDLSEEVFLHYGMEEIVPRKEGLVDSQPRIHFYTDEGKAVENPSNYRLKLKEMVSSLPKVVWENVGRTLEEKIESIMIEDTVSNNSTIHYALSKDKETWYVYDQELEQWEVVDISNELDFAIKGLRSSDFQMIQKEAYEALFQKGDSLYMAYRFYKVGATDECKFISIRINYVEPITKVV